jgi:hypothetical protein
MGRERNVSIWVRCSGEGQVQLCSGEGQVQMSECAALRTEQPGVRLLQCVKKRR